MKRESRFEKIEIAWAAHQALYAPGLISKVRAALPRDMPEGGLAHVVEAFQRPSRAIRSTTRSSAGKFPSRKMGVTIGFDSSTIELPTAMTLERSVPVIAFLDQSPQVRLTYKSSGRTRSHYHRPDFVVIYAGRVVLLECKRVGAINEKNASHPGFFVARDDGSWSCPAGENAAAQLGMQYVVWTDADFGPEMIRNLRYLNHFVTPERHPDIKPPDEIQEYLGQRGRATVAAVLEDLAPEICIDDVLSAIARNEVLFEFDQAPLMNPELCWLYRDAEIRDAFNSLQCGRSELSIEVTGASTVSLRAGDRVMWHGNEWDCLSVDGDSVMLSFKGAIQSFRIPLFLQLLDSGELTLVGVASDADGAERASARLLSASQKNLEIANVRLVRIGPYLGGGKESPDHRSIRRYLKDYFGAEREYGDGFGIVGLLPETDACGNRSPRVNESIVELFLKVVNEHYLVPDNRNRKAVYGLFHGECTALGYATPSYSWFCARIAKLDDFERELARKGRKGAYGLEPRIWIDGLPPAEFAFQHAHIDHTPLDLAVLLDLIDLTAIKLWVTVMLCSFSRRVLAFSLSYQPPSVRAVVSVIRECVRRHHRLPENIVCDGGKEFGAVWTETLLAVHKVRLQRRLASKPRGGSEGERMFGTVTTQVINFLTGNTQLTKDVRSMAREVNPFDRAVWNADRLRLRLAEYFYDVYDQIKHPTLLCTPRQAFESSIKSSGERAARLIRFDTLFLILTCATTRKGKAKVQPDGVKINYLYYNAPELRPHLGKSVPVRFDQFDLSNAWAFVGATWVKLVSRHASILTRFSQRDIESVTKTWLKERGDASRESLTQPRMIAYLQKLAADNAELLIQRLAIAERDLRSKDPKFEAIPVVADEASSAPLEFVVSHPCPIQHSRTQLCVSEFNHVEEL